MTKEPNKDEYTVCDQCRSRKIRCSREKPSCGNCNRLGLQCEWSGQGKKCSQTALLSHTILGIGVRLQSLEASIADTQRSLKRLDEASSPVQPISSRPLASPPRLNLQISQQFPSPSKTPIFTRPLGRFVLDQKNNERCYGPTSLESLMLNLKDELSEGPDIETNSLKECILQAQCKIDLLVDQREEEFVSEKLLPTTPPFAILDAMIEPYFTTINHHFPIWTKERFIRMATTLRQSKSSERDLASIICGNNLILMAMSADSLCSHRWEPMQTKQAFKNSSIDFDIIAGFLTNAKRAVKNIDQLLSPRLINVQALLSLDVADDAKHIVAQEYLSIFIAETLLALAARCAKSIGIYEWHSFQDQLGDEDIKETRNISYCLYILDKAVCWTAGSSPTIPASDIHFDPYLVSSENSTTSCLVAKAEIAKIEEVIYLEIYAIQAKARNEDQVRGFATTISSKLQGWLTDSGVDFDKIQKFPESSAGHLQLAIRYLCVQLLLIWPHKHHPDSMFQRAQEVAKMCMKLLLRLWHSPPGQGSHAVFPFFLASLPPLYLYEVLSSILCGQGSKLDIDMLQEFVDMLQAFTDCRAETSYSRRLYNLSLIVIDVANARKAQHKRQKSNPERLTNAYLASELLSLPTSSYNQLNSNIQAIDDSCFDSALFHDSDNSFAFLSPINSTTGELAQGPEEFFPNLATYVKTSSRNDHFNS